MAYLITSGVVGAQPIATTDTVQNHPLGKIVTAKDPTYGEGEFIYLKGASSTAVGSWVTYNMDDGTTTLIAPNAIGPVAVSMSANSASTSYGWYQIQGKAIASAADVADNAKVYIDTAAGRCDDAVVAGDKVHNAKWASAEDTATNLAEVEIARPFCTDEST
jgi:hypothetical protein